MCNTHILYRWRSERSSTGDRVASKSRVPPESFLPLSPVSFYVLLALTDGAKHGYAIMRGVADLTDGEVRLGSGTMYRAISSLLDDGLVEETTPDRPTYDDERRRYYALTTLGRSVWQAETKRMENAVKLSRAKRVQATTS